MPNLGVAKELKCQHRMEGSVLRVETVETTPTVRARNGGGFMTQTGNDVKVDSQDYTKH
jgi:hypothetical protein